MPLIKSIKSQLGLCVAPANNFTFDAAADKGTMKLARNSGQDIMTVDAAGKVTFPQGPVQSGPAFSAYDSAVTSIASGSSVKLNYRTETFDTDNCYDAANSRFTPNVAGYYQVTVCAAISGSATGVGRAAVAKNGTVVAKGSTSPNNAGTGLFSVASTLVYCNGSTDYIEAFGFQNSGAALGVGSNASDSPFSASLVRKTN